ncbi:MAG: FAD-binding protein [Candidatus Saccharimonadales bacterium]
MALDLRDYHGRLVLKLGRQLAGNEQPLRLQKKSISNLFRYDGRQFSAGRPVDLRRFNRPLYCDVSAQTLDVQGLATYQKIVDFTLPLGLVPSITPELKAITIGGAVVGIGLESNSFKFGFCHDGLLEAEVLLPDGRVVVARADNQYSDLFYGLANSYGTLGYILRAKIKLIAAKKYVALTSKKFDDTKLFLKALKSATENSQNDYIESLVYAKNELYLVTCRQVSRAENLTSIYGTTIFYKTISQPAKLNLTTKDYLFRYDPEWFWALPETPALQIFRRLAPPSLRRSGVYTRYVAISRRRAAKKSPAENPADQPTEQLTQDWQVPWPQAQKLLDFALDNLDLAGRAIMAVPLKTAARATLYPLSQNQLYLNLGSYNYVNRQPNQPPHHSTKIMDDFCFHHAGIKMLYSTTFLDEAEFNKIYNGPKCAALKRKYDPKNLTPSLFEKAVRGR